MVKSVSTETCDSKTQIGSLLFTLRKIRYAKETNINIIIMVSTYLHILIIPIVQWYNNNLQDQANDDHIYMGFCGSTLCDTADVKALVSGESRKDGDLLVVDMSWHAQEDFEITCPEVFQDPEIEILACQGSGGAMCTNNTCGGNDAPYEACFAEFDITLDPLVGNTILVDGKDPGGNAWTRIRLAILCVDFLSFGSNSRD
mmetsp:Transcript_11347/g.15897  ORF Transcript_11347/g.15897 Transcript_11347/m.15897 type:complete len:201 (-) Transcript_11347:92-694(-)